MAAGERDPGLAGERTELAWLRSAIALAALGAATVRAAPLPGLLILLVAVGVWWVSRSARGRGRTPGDPRRMRMIAFAGAAVAVAALMIVL
ncbi:DUF202 domain-containing protein [Actinocorallia sp. A-T 12471]|uniref:DUF202 domain-containing protein n=1 Tax=Actinocorallia sp. A-T 12471 TaxID=3089813 RepID=UPI0029D3F780|nr:DUF202 domain-containing protein [Actinocorallia sp. A-T 12471]MDX6738723.1 DUF202 domain-containing protein [Actinocorallia sp. A-T 12471]